MYHAIACLRPYQNYHISVIKVKVGIPESFRVGWYPATKLGRVTLRSEFALLQTLSRLFHLVYFVKCWQMLLELNSKLLHQSSGKERESCCPLFPSSTKRETEARGNSEMA